MSSERVTYSTRRKVLAASGSATMLGLAGCLGSDDETDDGTGTDDTETDDKEDDTGADENGETEQTVTLLVEGVGGHDDEDDAVSQFDVIDRDTDEVIADVDGDHWHGSLPHIPEGDHISLGAHIEDGYGDGVELDDHYELRVGLAEGATEDVVSFDFHGDHVHIIGENRGETEIVFQLYHDDHVDYETPPITVEVEDYDGHSDDEKGDEVDHEDEEEDDEHEPNEGDQSHADDEDDHGHDYGHEGLTDDEIGHACIHLEEIEDFGAEAVAGGPTAKEATHLSEVHHPYHVTFDGEAGYIKFEMVEHDDDHDDDGRDDDRDDDGRDDDRDDGELLAFFTQDGSADVVKGNLVYRQTEDVDLCGPMDRYILVEPDHGEAVVELSPEM